MLERDGYPPGVPCWVDTAQPDAEAAAGFYGELFGWRFEDRMPVDAPGSYLVAGLRGRDVAAVGSQPEGAPPTPAWSTYIWVDSADDAAGRIRDAGGRVLSEPFDVVDAGRMGVFSDPSGAAFCVWQAKDHRGAELVNEAGTWVFSGLNTRDLDGAKAFYGAVFGWEAASLALDGGEFMFWRRPGYGDFLESRDPDLRRRLAADGAPESFADAVASLALMSSDRFGDEVPPHWSVTFAVDDTDAIVDRAAGLGATVTVPPFDAGPTRVAVLTDPQGAAFSVSRYEPPGAADPASGDR